MEEMDCKEIQASSYGQETSISSSNSDEITVTIDCIQQQKDFLVGKLDPALVLEKLFDYRILSYEEMRRIKAIKDQYEQAEKILDVLLRKQREHGNVMNGFLQALKETNQMHLLNYLYANGVYNEELYGNDWPLTSDQIDILNNNLNHLIDIIDPSELLNELYSQKVITSRQRSSICADKTERDRNEAILHIVRCGSKKDFQMFLLCLQSTGQTHVAEILLDGGALMRLRTYTPGKPEEVSPFEDQITSIFARILKGRTLEEVQRMLELTQIKVANMKRGESIYLYVYCKTLHELMALHELLLSGEAKPMVERLFQRILSLSNLEAIFSVVISYSEEEYSRLKTFLTEKELKADKFGKIEAETMKREERKIDWKTIIKQEPIEMKIEESIFTSNYCLIAERLVISDLFLSCLQADYVITFEIIHEIEAAESPFWKAGLLLDSLRQRPDAFMRFVHALVETDQDQLAETLDNKLADRYIQVRNTKRSRFLSRFLGSKHTADSELTSLDSVTEVTHTLSKDISTPIRTESKSTLTDIQGDVLSMRDHDELLQEFQETSRILTRTVNPSIDISPESPTNQATAREQRNQSQENNLADILNSNLEIYKTLKRTQLQFSRKELQKRTNDEEEFRMFKRFRSKIKKWTYAILLMQHHSLAKELLTESNAKMLAKAFRTVLMQNNLLEDGVKKQQTPSRVSTPACQIIRPFHSFSPSRSGNSRGNIRAQNMGPRCRSFQISGNSRIFQPRPKQKRDYYQTFSYP